MIFTFIGMPGCGKSCMGRAVSGALKIRLLDSDYMIEKRQNSKLQDLIDRIGITEFRRIEEKTLLSIYDVPGQHIILSTGGSAVYSESAMLHLKSLGKIIYLYCSYPTIKERLGDFSKRGVVLRPDQTLFDLYEERTRLYERYADYTVNCDGKAYPKYQRKVMEIIQSFMHK